MSSLAASTRAAVRRRPFLYDALAAGVVNYTAAARALDVTGETEAIATALRRYAEELSEEASARGSARVNMHGGIGPADDGDDDPLLSVAEAAYATGSGSQTGIVATGEVDAAAFEQVLGALRTDGIAVDGAGFADDSIVLVVGRRDGPDALRAVEAVFES